MPAPFFATVNVGSVAGDGTGSRGQVPFQAVNTVINAMLGVVMVGGPADTTCIQFSRSAAYAGGTPGNTNNVLKLITNVTNAAATAFEWTFLSVMNNSATAGNNLAGYFQGNRQTTGTGPTWAAVCEARETVAINNPTTGLIGLEVDNRSNGTDTNFNRVGIDVVCSRFNFSGPNTVCSWGVRVQSGGDLANTAITQAFAAWQCNVGVAFDCANATVTSGALRMAQGVPILFDATATPVKLMSQGLGLDHFGSGGTLVNRLLNAGGLQVGSAQVVGPRINGWGASTNGARGAVNGSGATLSQTSAALAQLLIDLQTHGLIGA
jgi:hypothetical protein